MVSQLTVVEGGEGDPEPKRCVGLGVVYTLISTASFSLATTLLKRSAAKWHAFTVGVVSFPAAAIFFLPFLFHGLVVTPTSLKKGILPLGTNRISLFFVGVRTLFSSLIPFVLIWSLQYISVGDMRTILAAAVISVHFVGWLWLDEKCGVVPTIAAILALIGIGVMTRPPILTGKDAFDEDTLIGVSIALLAMAMVTVIIVVVRWLQEINHAVLNLTLYVWASIQSLALAAVFHTLEELSYADWGDLSAMLGVGILWAIGNLFLVLALQIEEAGIVGLIRTSEVVFTFGWQWILLGVPPDWISLLGAILVLSGVVVVIARKFVQSLPDTNTKRKSLEFLLL